MLAYEYCPAKAIKTPPKEKADETAAAKRMAVCFFIARGNKKYIFDPSKKKGQNEKENIKKEKSVQTEKKEAQVLKDTPLCGTLK